VGYALSNFAFQYDVSSVEAVAGGSQRSTVKGEAFPNTSNVSRRTQGGPTGIDGDTHVSGACRDIEFSESRKSSGKM
jgi:hypothetical protein